MIGLEWVSAQALSDTIGAIYDCALDPQRWFDAIRRIDELCDSKAGGICVHDLRHVQNTVLFEVGYSKGFSDTFQKHYEGSPLAATSILSDVGEVITLARMTADAELFESRFYREALKPFGILDFIGFMALRTGRTDRIHPCEPRGAAVALRRARHEPVSSALAARLPDARHLRCARYQDAEVREA